MLCGRGAASTLLASVCIPTYNRPASLALAVESVLHQTHQHFEVVVCDELGLAEAVCAGIGDDRIRYERNAMPLGFGRNHERCLQRARGDVLLFLHDDDRFDDPLHLERVLGVFARRPEAGLVVVDRVLEAAGTRTPQADHLPVGVHRDALHVLLAQPLWSLQPSNTSVSRAAYERDGRGPWLDSTVADLGFWLSIAEGGWELVKLAEGHVTTGDTGDRLSQGGEGHIVDFYDSVVRFWADQLRLQGEHAPEICTNIADTLIWRAGAHLRRGRAAAARADLARAWRFDRRHRLRRRAEVYAVSILPPALRRSLLAAR